MNLKLAKPLIVFDLEATGLDVVNDRIIQISYVKVYQMAEKKEIISLSTQVVLFQLK